MRFHFGDTSARASEDVALTDPMEELTAKMKAARDVQTLDALLHPASLFEGHANAEHEILSPRPGGFSKRFHSFFVIRRPHWCPSQVSEASQRFWLDYHSWMCRFCLPAGSERRHMNDTYALFLMDRVLEACTDFLAQRPNLNV